MLALFPVVDGCGTRVFAGLGKVSCVVVVRKVDVSRQKRVRGC
jgi:hypothetical protein